MAQRGPQKGPPPRKQSKLNFKPEPENGGPRLVPDVAAHVAAERERERAAAEQRRAEQMAARDAASGAAAVMAAVWCCVVERVTTFERVKLGVVNCVTLCLDLQPKAVVNCTPRTHI